VATEGGVIYVASSSGVGQFRRQSLELTRRPVDDLEQHRPRARRPAVARTDGGLLAYDGKKVERFDRRTGLADDRILDVVVDNLGRVWTRSTEGLSIVSP